MDDECVQDHREMSVPFIARHYHTLADASRKSSGTTGHWGSSKSGIAAVDAIQFHVYYHIGIIAGDIDGES